MTTAINQGYGDTSDQFNKHCQRHTLAKMSMQRTVTVATRGNIVEDEYSNPGAQ